VVNVDMLECALAKFEADDAVAGRPVLALTEITMRNLLAEGAEVDRRDFLARAELLAACGMTTIISDYVDYYRLAAYIGARTSERIGIVMGVPACSTSSRRRNHAHLPGGILESFGRLFKNDLKLYIYPLRRSEEEDLQTVDHLQVEEELRPLYAYLAGRGQLCGSDNFRPDYLSIFSRDVLKRIASGDDAWETMVPSGAVELIKKRGFFGYARSVRV
jgi:hypothetical protein